MTECKSVRPARRGQRLQRQIWLGMGPSPPSASVSPSARKGLMLPRRDFIDDVTCQQKCCKFMAVTGFSGVSTFRIFQSREQAR